MPSFYVLDVKHGNCSILFDKDLTTIIDAGPRTHLIDFLEKRNIKQVSTILISHADKDHIGGLMALLSSEIEINEIFINADSTKDNSLYDDLIFILYKKDKFRKPKYVPYLSTDINETINKRDIKIEVLAPTKYLIGKGVGSLDKNKRKITSNTISAVIKLSFATNHLILLPGDIDETGLDNLIEDYPDISAVVTLFPHHGGGVGSRNSKQFTQKFCEKVNPQHIIFSIRKNDASYPLYDILGTISKASPSAIMYTTNFSAVFGQHIELYKEHKNDVGTIRIELSSLPLNFDFERNG